MIYQDYKEYLKQQIVRAESKWGRKTEHNQIFKKNLKESWKKIGDSVGTVGKMCCMGCRDGTEVMEFESYYPKAEVYGVDITENINSIRGDHKIYLYDFNSLPKEWANTFDLIFSNSLDHAYDVSKTLKEWKRISKNGGHIFVELSTTPENNIEHSFKYSDIDKIFKDFEVVTSWETPERNIFSCLVRVVK